MKALQLVLAGVLFSACAFAGVVDEPALAEGVAVTHVSGSSVLKVYYSSGQTEDVKIAILDKKNKVIFLKPLRRPRDFCAPTIYRVWMPERTPWWLNMEIVFKRTIYLFGRPD